MQTDGGARPPASRPLDGLRVLVVEDRADVGELFAFLLGAAGAESARAATGREALDRFHAGVFDAVLCDLGLPDVHGEVLIRQLLEDATMPPAIAVITGYGEPHVTRARSAGAHAVFHKPVEWDAIEQFLRGLEPARSAAAVAAASARAQVAPSPAEVAA
jgi:CheY-like chemotaxis protein